MRDVKDCIQIVKKDITFLACDCIVNAANKALAPGSGVCGSIHYHAGIELWEECQRVGGCETGDAKITKGYRLPAKWVIHTVGPVYRGGAEDPLLLASCYRSSLNLAKENGIKSIAFPAISTGIYGYPLEPATGIAVDTVVKWLQDNADYDMTVIFSCYDYRTYLVYQKTLTEKGLL